MDNPRIGQIDGENVSWPEEDLRGQPYTRPPAKTVHIGGGYFVVVPINMGKAEMEAAIEALKPAEPPKSERTKGKVVNESEATG